MAPYALATKKHMAPCARGAKVTAGLVSNLPVLYCHRYCTVPYEDKIMDFYTNLTRKITYEYQFEIFNVFLPSSV